MKKIATLIAIVVCMICIFGCSNDTGNGVWNPGGDNSGNSDDTYNNSWPASEPLNDSDYSLSTNPKLNLVWNDEFNGTSLDLTKWRYDIGRGNNGWGNNEKQEYKQENVRVNGGKLQILAGYVNENSFTSGKILTEGKHSWKYGRFEARIRLPEGMGFWPAFWMCPQDSVYGGWPRSGEIDIMENKGREPKITSAAVHYGTNSGIYATGTNNYPTNNPATNFHTYVLEWREGSIKIYHDDFLVLNAGPSTRNSWFDAEINGENGIAEGNINAPFDQKFFLILNLAIGGTFDDGKVPSTSDFDKTVMEIDYVRIYEFND